MLCPNCRRLISRDQSPCPYCGIGSPGAWWKNTGITKVFSRGEQLIRLIIYVNVAMFILSLLLKPGLSGITFNPFTLLAPDNTSLFLLGATGTIPINRFHWWWTLVSANYLHGGIMHILFNMMALKQIGPLVIQEFGVPRMFVIYTLAGVLGFLVSYLAGVPFTIGASAAICGLIGATLYYGKSRGGTYGQQILRQIGSWVAFLFLFGFLVPGINNWGHGGGLAGGALLGFLLGYRERRRDNLLHRYLAGGCLAVTIIILLWAVFSGFSYQLRH